MLFCKTEIMAQNVAFACFDVNMFPQMLNSDGSDIQMQQKCCFLADFRLIFRHNVYKNRTRCHILRPRGANFGVLLWLVFEFSCMRRCKVALFFLFFRLGYIKFSLFASSAGEICVLHRYGTYLLRCSVLWRAAGRRAKSPKRRKAGFGS